MWDRRRAVSRVWLSALGKALGALALGAAVVAPIEVLGAGTAGADPTISFLLTGNVSTGASTTLTGTAYLDAGINPTPGSHLISVDYVLLPPSPNCYPPGTPCPSVTVAGGSPTLFGYLGEWNTTNTANGTHQLEVTAEDVDNATGTKFSFASYGPITITVDNPNPTTSVLIPSSGETVAGTSTLLDASASANVTNVTFELSGNGLSDQVISSGVPTIYGWLGQWNTLIVPFGTPYGTYTLQSIASYAGGVSGISAPITVTVNNGPITP
jgi:hypothetical protein